LALLLTGSVIADAYVLSTTEKYTDELCLNDEEGKYEGEKAEESESRGEKGSESLFDGNDGSNSGSFGKKQIIAQQSLYALLLPFFCSYAYYPHINNDISAPDADSLSDIDYPFFIKYHRLVFYDSVS
jgi:hypothetical protein